MNTTLPSPDHDSGVKAAQGYVSYRKVRHGPPVLVRRMVQGTFRMKTANTKRQKKVSPELDELGFQSILNVSYKNHYLKNIKSKCWLIKTEWLDDICQQHVDRPWRSSQPGQSWCFGLGDSAWEALSWAWWVCMVFLDSIPQVSFAHPTPELTNQRGPYTFPNVPWGQSHFHVLRRNTIYCIQNHENTEEIKCACLMQEKEVKGKGNRGREK